LDVPVIEPVTVSVAVIDWLPTVFSVAENVPAPLANVELAGKIAAPSLLVKWTVPAYPVDALLNASSAVTVKLNAAPAVCGDVADTVKCAAAPAFTVMVAVPVMEAVTVSVAATVWLPAVTSVTLNVWTPASPPVKP
jgi:hypothetical protein